MTKPCLVTITTRRIQDKAILHLLKPLFIWMLIFFAIFITMCLTDYYMLVIALIIEFLCIVPIAIVGCRNAQQLHQQSLTHEIISISAINGDLYHDNIKLDAMYDVDSQEIVIQYAPDEGRHNRHIPYFGGVIEGSDVSSFLQYCQENNIKLATFDD